MTSSLSGSSKRYQITWNPDHLHVFFEGDVVVQDFVDLLNEITGNADVDRPVYWLIDLRKASLGKLRKEDFPVIRAYSLSLSLWLRDKRLVEAFLVSSDSDEQIVRNFIKQTHGKWIREVFRDPAAAQAWIRESLGFG